MIIWSFKKCRTNNVIDETGDAVNFEEDNDCNDELSTADIQANVAKRENYFNKCAWEFW